MEFSFIGDYRNQEETLEKLLDAIGFNNTGENIYCDESYFSATIQDDKIIIEGEGNLEDYSKIRRIARKLNPARVFSDNGIEFKVKQPTQREKNLEIKIPAYGGFGEYIKRGVKNPSDPTRITIPDCYANVADSFEEKEGPEKLKGKFDINFSGCYSQVYCLGDWDALDDYVYQGLSLSLDERIIALCDELGVDRWEFSDIERSADYVSLLEGIFLSKIRKEIGEDWGIV